jgi:hypothetical protein
VLALLLGNKQTCRFSWQCQKKLCSAHRHIHRIFSYVDKQFLFVLWQQLRHSGGEGDCRCLAICWQISWNHKAGSHILFMSCQRIQLSGYMVCYPPRILAFENVTRFTKQKCSLDLADECPILVMKISV